MSIFHSCSFAKYSELIESLERCFTTVCPHIWTSNKLLLVCILRVIKYTRRIIRASSSVTNTIIRDPSSAVPHPSALPPLPFPPPPPHPRSPPTIHDFYLYSVVLPNLRLPGPSATSSFLSVLVSLLFLSSFHAPPSRLNFLLTSFSPSHPSTSSPLGFLFLSSFVFFATHQCRTLNASYIFPSMQVYTYICIPTYARVFIASVPRVTITGVVIVMTLFESRIHC